MAGENRTFTLVGKFDDRITPSLKKLNREISALEKNLSKTFKGLGKDLDSFGGKGVSKLTSSLEDAGKAAGKVRDTVSQIGEGVKGLDGIAESLESAARAAGRAQSEVAGIGEAAGKATRQAENLMDTLLKAEGLSKFGDAMAQGFERGMGVITGTAQKGASLVARLFKESMEDELSDIKAASGIQGSFGLAGYKGSFNESEKMYKKYDQVVSEMIRQSSAPTAKVVELQRYTLDTMGPLMLAAQGVKKGTDMKNIDPKAIQASATQYGQFLEKAALFSQGTGSAGFRVAAGIEGLVTRGKIDTTLDFFTDNIMLMKNLEAAGFAGRGASSSKMMSASDAERMKAMMDAFNKSMSSESTAAMAQSLTGAMQGLEDTIFNPSVGILGMSVTFSKEEQKRANSAIAKIQNQRIANYQKELATVQKGSKREEELKNNIEQATATRDALIKDGADKISTPFKAFSYAFTGVIRSLTNALSAIGPVWTNFAVAAIEVTNTVFGPLAESLENVASNMRGGKMTQSEGFGRIVGEIFKSIGKAMSDLATMIADPSGGLGKIQSEFVKGFMSAFKDPADLEKAKEGISRGITALIGKAMDFLWKVLTFEPLRPLILSGIAAIFGPPLISAAISGITPMILSGLGNFIMSIFTGGGAAGALASIPIVGWVAMIAGAFIVFQGPLLAFASWLTSAGTQLMTSKSWMESSFGFIIAGIGRLLSGVTNFFAGLWDVVVGLVTGDADKVVAGIKRVFSGIGSVLAGVAQAAVGLGGVITSAIGNVFRAVAGVISRAVSALTGMKVDAPANNKKLNPLTGKLEPAPGAKNRAYGHSGTTSLGNAIQSEIRNKPAGSNLVIANDSETIIPAADGLNMGGLNAVVNATYSAAQTTAGVFSAGFRTFSEKLFSGQQAMVGAINRGTQASASQNATMLAKLSAQNAALMSKMSAVAAAAGNFGGGGGGGGGISLGGGYGGRGSQIAGALGRYIKQTGGAPGSIHEHPEHGGVKGRHSKNSYHYQGRAIDIGAYSYEQGGVLSRIAQFNQKMGVKPVELLKAGDPGHSDHVHVAYALGANNPAFFSTQRAATSWENKMMPPGARVRSVTSNTSESLGGGTTVGNINVTVNAGQTNNPDQLAAMVAQRLSQAIMEVRSASILV